MGLFSPTDCTDGRRFIFSEHEICRRPTDQREVIPTLSVRMESVGDLFGGKDTAFGKSRFPSYRREITINKFTINNIF